MLSLMTLAKAQKKLAEQSRQLRFSLQLTQEGLALRSGVPLATVRLFEQKGIISLEGFLKLQMVLGCLEPLVQSVQPQQTEYTSIDEVLRPNKRSIRKRGRLT